MPKPRTIAQARHWFAEDLRVAAPVVNNPAIISAFAKIPREAFLGKGPWRIHPRQFDRPAYISPTAHPGHIYHDVLVSIDHERGINNGLPSLWAYYLDQMAIKPGAMILQVGAGVGYFSAILAELVAPAGRVIAYEMEDMLARKARENLKGYPNVTVVCGDASQAPDLPKLDAIIAFAGATHIPEPWLSSLSETGRIIIPITADDQWGFMLLLQNDGDHFSASSLGKCGFFHCVGARNRTEAEALKGALQATDGIVPRLGKLQRGKPSGDDESAWYIGDGFWISKA